MQTNEQMLSAIENYLAQTEFPAEPELLYAPIGYSLAGGGKRLRPMLLTLSCGIFSDDVKQALPAAAAVEVFHNFTLLHDDIMDNAAVRRGKPSVHAKWGQNVAILSGDAMMIYAYRLLSSVPANLLPQVLSTFNTMALEVCEGQQYDMDFEQKPKVSVVEYMHMIELKTSVLLAGSVVIGAMLGGASDEDCLRLRRFAVELGLAFQLQDDLLDSYGDQRLGKAIGGDILEGKKTYLMITAMSHADEATREMLRTAYRDPALSDAEKIGKVTAHDTIPRPIRPIGDVVSIYDVDAQCSEREEAFTSQALGLLETFGIVYCIHAADAMCKAADVELVGFENTASGYISAIVEGDVGACKTAVAAGVKAVAEMGKEVYSSVVIARPHPGIKKITSQYSLEKLLPAAAE